MKAEMDERWQAKHDRQAAKRHALQRTCSRLKHSSGHLFARVARAMGLFGAITPADLVFCWSPRWGPNAWVQGCSQQVPLAYSQASQKYVRMSNGRLRLCPANTMLDTEGEGFPIELAKTNYEYPSLQAAGAKTACEVSVDATVAAPDEPGTLGDVRKQSNDGTNAEHYAAAAQPTTTGSWTFSAYVKAGTCGFVHLLFPTDGVWAQFNLSTGATTFSGGGGALKGSGAFALADGWLVVYVAGQLTIAQTPQLYFLDAAQNSATPVETSSGYGYHWHRQLENFFNGPTTLIPTTSGNVTRTADSLRLDSLALMARVQERGTLLLVMRKYLATSGYYTGCAVSTSDVENGSVRYSWGDAGRYTVLYVNNGLAVQYVDFPNQSAVLGLLASAGNWDVSAATYRGSGQGAAVVTGAALSPVVASPFRYLRIGGERGPSRTPGWYPICFVGLFARALTDAELRRATAQRAMEDLACVR